MIIDKYIEILQIRDHKSQTLDSYLLIVKMSSLMVLHVSFGTETLTTALRAYKWSLILVNSHVNP